MQHWILRCKHCKKEYVYCTYGNGEEYGTEEGCSATYCAECQRAIDNALNAIPMKFKPKMVEINDEKLISELEQIKQNSIKNNHIGTRISEAIFDETYDCIEKYTHDGYVYLIKFNEETPDDKHLFVQKEFDIANNKITDRFWKADTHDDLFLPLANMGRIFFNSDDLIRSNPLPPPSGKLFYINPV